MTLYLDASVLVALFTNDDLSERAAKLLVAGDALVISDFAAAEFASAVARLVRMRSLRDAGARNVFVAFDNWTASNAMRAESAPSDMAVCDSLLRRLDLPLRTGDALNMAIAQRLGAIIATLDTQMARSAQSIGLVVRTA